MHDDFEDHSGRHLPLPDSAGILRMMTDLSQLLGCQEFGHVDLGERRDAGFTLKEDSRDRWVEIRFVNGDSADFLKYAKPKLTKKYGGGRVKSIKNGFMVTAKK
jgi:hypothetical protein